MRTDRFERDVGKCLPGVGIGCVSGCLLALAALLWSHVLPFGLGAISEAIVSFPCQHILMPVLMAADNSLDARVAIGVSSGLWAVVGGAVGAALCRLKAAARGFVSPLWRALLVIAAVVASVLLIGLGVSAITSALGLVTYVPGLAGISASTGVRFPWSAGLSHAACFWGLRESTTYAVVTIARAKRETHSYGRELPSALDRRQGCWVFWSGTLPVCRR